MKTTVRELRRAIKESIMPGMRHEELESSVEAEELAFDRLDQYLEDSMMIVEDSEGRQFRLRLDADQMTFALVNNYDIVVAIWDVKRRNR
jgi:hypothetical protein